VGIVVSCLGIYLKTNTDHGPENIWQSISTIGMGPGLGNHSREHNAVRLDAPQRPLNSTEKCPHQKKVWVTLFGA
jgi:hypothetical protein